MFYPMDSVKKGGKFHIIWMADSWPTRFAHLNYRQIMTSNIVFICDELLEVISLESRNPLRNFSLRLSSMLIHGTVRLFERKATLLINDLCMLNANVFKHLKERREPLKKRPRVQPVVPAPLLVPAELTEAEEQLMANMMEYNVVARIEDITLREQEIPQKELPYDGFGEVNENQALEVFNTTANAIEMMRRGTSGLVDNTLGTFNITNVSKEQSRIQVAGPSVMEPMETSAIEEAAKDTTLFLPNPDAAPEQRIKTPEPMVVESTPHVPKTLQPAQPAKPKPSKRSASQRSEIDIEELQPIAKRPKRQRKLIIDKKIMFSAEYMKSRQIPNVELRVEIAEEDIVNVLIPPHVYYERPAGFGHTYYLNMGEVPRLQFKRNLVSTKAPKNLTPAHFFTPRQEQNRTPNMSVIRTDAVPPEHESITHPEQPGLPQETVQLEMPQLVVTEPEVMEVTVAQPEVMEVTVAQPEVIIEEDVHEKVTQILEKKSPEKVAATEQEAQLPRRSERRTCTKAVMTVTPDKTQKQVPFELEMSNQEVNLCDSIGPIPMEPIPARLSQEQRLDIIVQLVAQEKTKDKRSSDSESPKGSIDRTQVHLGDSPSVTESQAALRSAFSSENVLLKVAQMTKHGDTPITLKKLLGEEGRNGKRSVCAALCFNTLLKLSTARFVELVKEPGCIELAEIRLGQRSLIK